MWSLVALISLLACTECCAQSVGPQPVKAPFSIDDILDASGGMPNPLTTPELSDDIRPASGGPQRRRLQEQQADGSFHHIHYVRDFTGVTKSGFIDLHVNALLLNTSVRLADYTALLMAPGAELDCSSPQGAPAMSAEGAITKSALVFTVTLPSSLDASLVEELVHLQQRSLRGHSFIFGFSLLQAAPAFRTGGACAHHLPVTSAYYTITSAKTLVTDTTTAMTFELMPASLDRLFGGYTVNMEWDPQPEREIAARRRLNQPLPHDIGAQLSAFHSRRLAYTGTVDTGFNMNYNSVTKKALNSMLSVFSSSPNILYCTNCYAFLQVKLTLNMQMCLKTGSLFSSGWEYDTTSLFTGIANPKDITKDLPDCAALRLADPYVGDVALKASAILSGDAGFDFLLQSDGIDGATSTCASGSRDIDQLACFSTILPSMTLSPFIFTIAGLPISITPTIGLTASGYATSKMPGHFEIGAKASASIKAGASVAFYGTYSGAPASSYNFTSEMSASWTNHPFVLTGFTSFTGRVGAIVKPTVLLMLYDSIPVYINPAFNTNLAVDLSWGRRRLSDTDRRVLQPVQPVISRDCSGSGDHGSFEAAYGSTLVAGVSATKISDFKPLTAITDALGVTSSLPVYTLTTAANSGPISVTPPTILLKGCMDRNGVIPSPTPAPVIKPPPIVPSPTPAPVIEPPPIVVAARTVVTGFLLLAGLPFSAQLGRGAEIASAVSLCISRIVGGINPGEVVVTGMVNVEQARRLSVSGTRIAFRVTAPSASDAISYANLITAAFGPSPTSTASNTVLEMIATIARATAVTQASLAPAIESVQVANSPSGSTSASTNDLVSLTLVIGLGAAAGVLLICACVSTIMCITRKSPVSSKEPSLQSSSNPLAVSTAVQSVTSAKERTLAGAKDEPQSQIAPTASPVVENPTAVIVTDAKVELLASLPAELTQLLKDKGALRKDGSRTNMAATLTDDETSDIPTRILRELTKAGIVTTGGEPMTTPLSSAPAAPLYPAADAYIATLAKPVQALLQSKGATTAGGSFLGTAIRLTDDEAEDMPTKVWRALKKLGVLDA